MTNFPRRIGCQAAILLAIPLHPIMLTEQVGASIGDGTAVIRTPKRHVLQNGTCWLYEDGTYMADWTGKDGSKLMFAIGPAMWEFVRFSSKKSEPEKYHGPGKYQDVWMTFTSADVNVGWIDTVTVNPDGKTGNLTQNGSIVGTWNCGGSPKQPKKLKK